jgi:hypothetical protein
MGNCGGKMKQGMLEELEIAGKNGTRDSNMSNLSAQTSHAPIRMQSIDK